ncbi:MAG: DNA polymerase [Alphaproteobacteria bacterium]|nr:DNA polymerase [Alphaproteobacteria bacterium]
MTSHAFKIITDAQSLDEFLAGVSDTLAIDTETTGLDQMTARIVGISLATAPDAGVYIPIRHIDKNPNDLFGEIKSETRSQKSEISIDTVKQKLWPILTNDNIIKVGHNIKYDLHILENEGWDTSRIAPIDDTMTLSYILHGTAHAHSLDELAHLYLAHDTIKFDSLFPPKTKDADKNFASLDIGAAGEYAAEDAYITFALYKIFRPKVDADETLRKLYENCDRPLIRILLSMERAGVLVDQARLAGLSTILHKKSDELAREIWALAGKEFNIASPQQLAVVLFDELQIAIPGKNRSTDAGVLSEISEAHAIVPKILEWRSLTKLSGTYADALPRQIGADGRIHTTYHQAGTNTGRLSSSGPNLQNIPIKTELGASIRKCFVAAPGKVLISCDYSQVQLRMMADVADVAALKESFARGDDIHEMTARKIFNIPADAPVGKEQRYAAKTVNFSIIYGISPFGLSAQLDIPQSAAKNLIDSYMANFPAIGEYMERTKQFVMAHGFVATPWGRRIELPDVRNPRTRAYALRAAINAPIQGFEADLMRYAMDKVANVIANHKPQIRMIMQVHDEMVFECDAAAAEDWAQKIKSEMENAAKLSVPLVADYSIGNSWE